MIGIVIDFIEAKLALPIQEALKEEGQDKRAFITFYRRGGFQNGQKQ